MSRVYSQSALAQAGAFVRMLELNEEVAYLKRFLRTHPESNGRRRTDVSQKPAVETPVTAPKKAAKAAKAVKAVREPKVGNSFAVPVARAARKPGQHGMAPVAQAGKTVRRRVEEIVRELMPTHRDGVRPIDVAERLKIEGWDLADPLRTAQGALRHAMNLSGRKVGPARSAAIYYTVRA